MLSVTKLISRLADGIGWWNALRRPGRTRVLGVNALVDSMGTGIAVVCLPFYVLLSANVTPAQFAFVLASGGAAELLLAVPNGSIAGRVGVFRFAIFTRICHCLLFTAYAFTSSFAEILTLSIAIGALRGGASGINQSLTISVVGTQERQSALAVIRSLRNVGYLTASGLAGILLSLPGSIPARSALALNGVTFAVSAVLLRSVRPPDSASQSGERFTWAVLRDGPYLLLIGAASVFATSATLLTVAVPLWLVRHSSVPRYMAAVVLGINTVMVILLQHGFAVRVETTKQALRSIWRAAGMFALMSAMFAFAGNTPTTLAAVCLIVIGILVTFGELFESPAWWTLSYVMAPRARATQ